MSENADDNGEDLNDRALVRSETADAQDSFSKVLEQAGVPPEAANRVSEIILSVTETEMTNGPFPPPRMLEKYKEIDSRFVDVFIDGYTTQSNHRREMEKFATEQTIKISSSSNMFSSIIAILGLISSVGMIAYFEVKDIKYDIWVVLGLLLIAVGGKPVAHVLAQIIANSKREPKE
jgi:uncharacterized membrane protein